MNEETVTITKKEYDSLIRSAKVLLALEAGGVDNWEGYSESLQEFWAENEKGENNG